MNCAVMSVLGAPNRPHSTVASGPLVDPKGDVWNRRRSASTFVCSGHARSVRSAQCAGRQDGQSDQCSGSSRRRTQRSNCRSTSTGRERHAGQRFIAVGWRSPSATATGPTTRERARLCDSCIHRVHSVVFVALVSAESRRGAGYEGADQEGEKGKQRKR